MFYNNYTSLFSYESRRQSQSPICIVRVNIIIKPSNQKIIRKLRGRNNVVTYFMAGHLPRNNKYCLQGANYKGRHLKWKVAGTLT